jgi:hypothetical protein
VRVCVWGCCRSSSVAGLYPKCVNEEATDSRARRFSRSVENAERNLPLALSRAASVQGRDGTEEGTGGAKFSRVREEKAERSESPRLDEFCLKAGKRGAEGCVCGRAA